MSESLRFNRFIQPADSTGSFNRLIHSETKHLTVLMSESLNHCYQPIRSKTDSFNKTPSIAQRRKVLWSLFGTIFVGKIEQKQAILCLKCKLLIALLNLYKMIIKCVIMLISAEKRYSLCDTD